MITQVRVENYKSIVDTDWVDIGQSTTVLVGPNEAGKSNFIEALSRFTPGESIPDDVLSEYIDEEQTEQTPDCRISVKFEKTEIRLQQNSQFSAVPRKSISAEVSGVLHKYRNGRYEFSSEETLAALTEYQNERENLVERILSKWMRERRDEIERISTAAMFEIRRTVDVNEEIKKYKQLVAGLSEMRSMLNKAVKDTEDEDEKEKISSVEQDLLDDQRRLEEFKPLGKRVAEEIFNPKICNDFGIVPDKISYQSLADSERGEKYRQLLEFIGLSIDEVQSLPSPKRREVINKGTKRFSEEFNKYWIEDDIEFDMDLVGDNIEMLISDQNGGEQFVSQRSEGFQHFLSFMIEYVRSSGNSAILIDDPDLHLHPEAQKEFTKALQNMADDRNVIYTTHSPYMIDKNKLNSIRLVKKKSDSDGTKILSNFSIESKLNEDVMQPVRAALGATFADSLFASKRTVLVEGYTDHIYLNRLAEHFQRKEELPSFEYDVSILDVNGASHLTKYARLLESEGYNYVIIPDNDKSGSKAINKIIDSENIESSKIVTPATGALDIESWDFENNSLRMEIEKVFSIEFYSARIAEVYENVNKEEIKKALGSDREKREKQVVAKFDQLRGKEGRKIEEFDKSKVADHIDKKIFSG